MFMSSVVMVVLLAAPAQPAAAAPLKWKVSGTDVAFEMTAEDLRALRGGKEVFGLKSREKGFLSNFEVEEGQDPTGWEAFQSFKVLSVVGPWVSYEESNSGFTGGAHPYASTSYVLKDVSKEQGSFSLMKVFPEKDVLKALKADTFVRKHISDQKAFDAAKTVEAMLETLDEGEDCVGFRYGLDAVERGVAFHHIEGNKVAVRIAFGYASEACRGNFFVVGILLPIPASLKPALDRAAKRTEGFLMKDAKAVKAPTVAFSWEPPEPKEKE
ncbi:hypothetical protein [Hyalangium minutum]|uniref:Uncharacterized protein n=1 Tax=Hyalangium minutum TaxID=394096 RepID=A0A085WIG4_9BACT|nr:hypothetical protein [Hyalangium minutum]KFE67477.1 hypothetical protein DB31_8830 [Hyalangium minutum]